MATLAIHACSPSLSTVKVEASVAARPYVILSLLPAARGLGSRRGLSSRGPCPRRHSAKRGVLAVPRASLGQLPDPEHVDMALGALSKSPEALQALLTRTEGLFFTLADAAVATDPGQVTDAVVQKPDGGWLGGITSALELALTFLKDGIAKLNIPYSYGFAIILLTVLVKLATYPLTKKQVESTLAMQNLQPKIKAIQDRYKGDQERIQLETARLYKQAGVNPLAGCLPTLATLPVWIGLYRALSNVANEGLLTEGFFWIPSLAGPTTIAARTSGSGVSWLFPFVKEGLPFWRLVRSFLQHRGVMTTIVTQACSLSPSTGRVEAIGPFSSYTAVGTSGVCLRCCYHGPGFGIQFTRASRLVLRMRCACRGVGVIRCGLGDVGEGKMDKPFVYTRAKPEVRWPHKIDELNSQRISREAENAGRVTLRLEPDWEELSYSDAVVREGEEEVSKEGQTSFARRLEREEMIKKRDAFRQRQKGEVRRLRSMSKLALRKVTDLQNKARRLSSAICLLETSRPITDVLDDWPEQLNNDELSAVVKNVGDNSWQRALELYEWLNLRKWYTPNPRLLAVILHILGRANQLETARELFLKAEPELTSCIQVFNAILGVYAKQGQWQAAEHILELIALRGCEPDIITFNTIANARCKYGLQPGMASAFLKEIESAGLRPDIVTYNTLLGGCIAMKYFTEASDIIKEMEQCGFDLVEGSMKNYVMSNTTHTESSGLQADDPHQTSTLDICSSDATRRPGDESRFSVICLFMQWNSIYVMSAVVQCTLSLRFRLGLGSKELGSRKFRPCRMYTCGWIFGDVYHVIISESYRQLHLCKAAQAPDTGEVNHMMSKVRKSDSNVIQVAVQGTKEESFKTVNALSYTRLMNECMIKREYASGLEQLRKMVDAGIEPGYMTWISVLQACVQCANRIDLLRLLAALRDAGCTLPLRLLMEREAAISEVEIWLRDLRATAADAGQGMVNVLVDILWAFKLRATAGHIYDIAVHLDIYPRNFAKVEEGNWEADFRNLSPGTALVALNHWFIEMQKASLDGFPERPKEVLMITGTQGYQNGVSLNKTIRAHLWEMGSPFYMRPPREGALISKGHALELWLKDSPRCFNLELEDSVIIPKTNSMSFFKGAWMSNGAVPVMMQIHTSIGEVWPRKYSKLAHMTETRRIEALAARIENDNRRRLEKRDIKPKKKKGPLGQKEKGRGTHYREPPHTQHID